MDSLDSHSRGEQLQRLFYCSPPVNQTVDEPESTSFTGLLQSLITKSTCTEGQPNRVQTTSGYPTDNNSQIHCTSNAIHSSIESDS